MKTSACLILIALACSPAMTWAADPAPVGKSDPTAAPKAEDLPYGAGYEAREAVRAGNAERKQETSVRPDSASRPAQSAQQRPATAGPDAAGRAAAGGHERAAPRAPDRPRSSNGPPRPERTRWLPVPGSGCASGEVSRAS